MDGTAWVTSMGWTSTGWTSTGWAPGYREFAPPPWLCDTLSCLWVRVGSPDRAVSTLVLPDAASDLIWCAGSEAILAGPDTGPMPDDLTAGTLVLGARFRPGAGGPALGLPLAELLNQRVSPAEIPALRGRFPSADLPPERALAELADLVASLASDNPGDPVAMRAARLAGRCDGRAEDIAATLGLSERQLRRRCQAGIGYGPRTLRRVLRFRRFVSVLDAGVLPPGGLAAAAVAAGYADQPHLTRECVALSGLTPQRLALARSG